jgi:hypothetical protein
LLFCESSPASIGTITLCVASRVLIADVYVIIDTVWKLLGTPSYSLKVVVWELEDKHFNNNVFMESM